MLSLYRAALGVRRALPGMRESSLTWRESPADVLIFDRGQALRCVVNLSPGPFPLHGHGVPVLSSIGLDSGQLPSDATAWLTQGSSRSPE